MEKTKMFQTTNQLWMYSMAMQQEPINWRYVYHISGLFFRAKFQGIIDVWRKNIFFPSTIFEEPQRVDPQD